MPISGGNYVAPTWANNGPPAINASELQAMSDSIVSNQSALSNKVDNSRLTYGTTDLTPGTSPLTTGVFYFVYE